MNDSKLINRNNSRKPNAKFICSICLNTKPVCDSDLKSSKGKTKSCPICQMNCNICKNANENKLGEIKERKCEPNVEEITSKTVQTSQKDISQGLNLLQEVLTVFQSKKQIDVPKNGKTIIYKDACVDTDDMRVKNGRLKHKLIKSKLFHYSIETDDKTDMNGMFTVVNSSQPYIVNKSQASIELIKHKSSSIPQMKLDELKNSLKEKTKLKNAIDEVNRMFATVKKKDLNGNESNRPLVRNGPRVLPLVKTEPNGYQKRRIPSSDENFAGNEKQNMNNFLNDNDALSSGDCTKHECCYHHKKCEEDRCDKGVYMLCCHHKTYHQHQTGASGNDGYHAKRESYRRHGFMESNFDDSCSSK